MASIYEVEHEGEIYEVEASSPEEATAAFAEFAPAQPTQTPESPEAPSLLSQAKHVAKGLGETAINMTVDLPHNLSTIANMATEGLMHLNYGREPEGGFPQTPIVPKVSDKGFMAPVTEALASDEFPREAAPTADTLRTAVEWGAGGLPNAVRKLSVRPDLYMGLMAGGGQWLADYFDADPTSGELAGGMTGLVAALKRGDATGLSRSAKKAYEFIKSNMTDTPLATTKLRKALESKQRGTLADLTEDPGVYNVEAGVARMSDDAASKMDDIQTLRDQQISDEVAAPFGTAEPATAAETALTRTMNKKAGIRTRTDTAIAAAQADAAPALDDLARASTESTEQALVARQAAEAAEAARVKAGTPLETTQSPAQASTKVQQLTAAERKAVSDEASALWKKFEAQPPIDRTPITSAIKTEAGELSTEALTMFKDKYGKLLNYFKGEGDILPGDVHNILRRMKAAKAKAIESGDYGPDEEILQKFITRIEDNLVDSNGLFKQANAATTEKYARFGDLDKSAGKVSPERYAKKINYADEAGAEAARIQAKADIPGLPKANLELLKTWGAREGVTDKFLAKYADQLDALPAGQRQQFDDYARALNEEKAAAAAAKKATAEDTSTQLKTLREDTKLRKALAAEEAKIVTKGSKLKGAVDKTWVGKYATAPEKTLTTLLNSTDSVGSLRSLNRSLTNSGEKAAFKAHVGRKLKDTLLKGGVTDDLRRTLVDSGVMTLDEVNDIARAVNKTKSVGMRKKALEVHAAMGGEEWTNLLASASAATAGTALPSGHSLVMIGALRRYFKYFLGRAGDPKQLRALEEFVLNPQSYLKAAELTDVTEGAEAARRVMSKVVGASQMADAINELGEEDAP